MIYARKCIRCKNYFDQDTSKELCPKCRRPKDVEYALFKRVDKQPCKYLDEKDLFVKYCKKCKKVFDKEMDFCDGCIYTKNTKKHNKGESYQLILKPSNKDVCTLQRGEFKKRTIKNGEDC